MITLQRRRSANVLMTTANALVHIDWLCIIGIVNGKQHRLSRVIVETIIVIVDPKLWQSMSEKE
jgi:hypothetical protein